MTDSGRSFAMLDALRHEMDRMFEGFEGDWSWGLPLLSGATLAAWPRMHMEDSGDALRVYAEIPGMRAQDVHITLERDTLTLRGERNEELPEGYAVRRKERGALRFARSLTLPVRVDADAVTATMRNGVLELCLPKSAEERPRSIAVKAA
jgi:HSP20 family protein